MEENLPKLTSSAFRKLQYDSILLVTFQHLLKIHFIVKIILKIVLSKYSRKLIK